MFFRGLQVPVSFSPWQISKLPLCEWALSSPSMLYLDLWKSCVLQGQVISERKIKIKTAWDIGPQCVARSSDTKLKHSIFTQFVSSAAMCGVLTEKHSTYSQDRVRLYLSQLPYYKPGGRLDAWGLGELHLKINSFAGIDLIAEVWEGHSGHWPWAKFTILYSITPQPPTVHTMCSYGKRSLWSIKTG